MEKAIIGKKIGMTQIFDADGKVIPVTVIEAGPCTVVQKKTEEKDGYNAVQLGYGDVAERKLTKPELGHLKKAGDARKKTLKEFKLAKAAEMNVGDEVKVDVFAEGDRVDVTGISKGHGYQGVIKRHGAHRLKETHGSGPVVRHAGSMGANSDPSRIFKGQDRRRPDGQRAGHRPQSGRGEGGRRAGHPRRPRRDSRPQGRHRVSAQLRDQRQGEGRRRWYLQQPAEGFRPRQSPEGFRP